MVYTSGVNTVAQLSGGAQSDLQRLREVTGRVVGSVFFGTLLKTMRESELKGPFGHGGRGEQVFAAQLHGILAERMGETMRGGLDEVLYRSLERQQRLISEASTSSTSGARGELPGYSRGLEDLTA